MRKLILAMLALSAAGAATLADLAPAAAYDYPWCVQGRGVGFPGDCSYTTYGQCMASASGRAPYCNVNPRVAFGQQQRAWPGLSAIIDADRHGSAASGPNHGAGPHPSRRGEDAAPQDADC